MFVRDKIARVTQKIDSLISEHRIETVDEVLREVGAYDKKALEWVKKNIPHDMDVDTINHLKMDVLPKYGDILKHKPNPRKPLRAWADPWLIAKAMPKILAPQLVPPEYSVVTEEDEDGEKLKIPYICKLLNVKCMSLSQMMQNEGIFG